MFAGETAQVHAVRQVVPDAWRPQIAHVRAQRVVAVQMSHLQSGVQQAHESEESLVPAHR